MTPGGPGTELMDGIEAADSDLVSTRIGGLSPVNGTDVPTLLRNLGAKTVVIAGVSTNVAIPNATLDCVNFGFNVVIARDAITGYPVDYTDVIIKNTLSLVAKITTTDELVDALVVARTAARPARRSCRAARRASAVRLALSDATVGAVASASSSAVRRSSSPSGVRTMRRTRRSWGSTVRTTRPRASSRSTMSVMFDASKCRDSASSRCERGLVEVAQRRELRRREIEGRGETGHVGLHRVHDPHEMAQHVAGELRACSIVPPGCGHAKLLCYGQWLSTPMICSTNLF